MKREIKGWAAAAVGALLLLIAVHIGVTVVTLLETEDQGRRIQVIERRVGISDGKAVSHAPGRSTAGVRGGTTGVAHSPSSTSPSGPGGSTGDGVGGNGGPGGDGDEGGSTGGGGNHTPDLSPGPVLGQPQPSTDASGGEDDSSTPQTSSTVDQVVDGAQGAVDQVQDTVDQTTDAVGKAVDGLAGR